MNGLYIRERLVARTTRRDAGYAWLIVKISVTAIALLIIGVFAVKVLVPYVAQAVAAALD